MWTGAIYDRAMPSRLYLDNAATSFPKPQRVHDAMMRYAMEVGGTAGRGNYAEAIEGSRVINECRRRLCQYINGESWRQVVFALNTSDALNLAIKGVVLGAWKRGGGEGRAIHVVATEMEHNSVLRPLNALAELINGASGREVFSWTCVEADGNGLVPPGAIAGAIRPETVLVAAIHASNVTGTIQPIAEYGRVCREARVSSPKPGGGVPLLIDAAQSLGHEPVDVRAMDIDLLAFPGHKGLLGPLGTGGLYIRPGVEAMLDSVREGGTGSQSENDVQPASMPERYEPGSQNALGLAGLSEGVASLIERGDAVYEHDRMLRGVMLEELAALDALGDAFGRLGLKLLGPREAAKRVGVFSLVHESFSPAELAGLLEQEHGILTRAGLSCAPRVHQRLGTSDGGALRMSIGPFVSDEDVRRACRALGEICGASSSPVVRAISREHRVGA